MDIQFYHGTKNKYHEKEFTVAVLIPPLSYFQNLLYEFRNGKDDFNLSFGVSVVNKADGDNYVKKTGRIVSTEKIKNEPVKVSRIFIDRHGNTEYSLNNGKYTLVFQQRRGRDKAYLMSVREY